MFRLRSSSRMMTLPLSSWICFSAMVNTRVWGGLYPPLFTSSQPVTNVRVSVTLLLVLITVFDDHIIAIQMHLTVQEYLDRTVQQPVLIDRQSDRLWIRVG